MDNDNFKDALSTVAHRQEYNTIRQKRVQKTFRSLFAVCLILLVAAAASVIVVKTTSKRLVNNEKGSEMLVDPSGKSTTPGPEATDNNWKDPTSEFPPMPSLFVSNAYEDQNDSHLSKIHFSVAAFEDVIIDNRESLELKLDMLKKLVTGSSELNDEVILTIEFNYSLSDSTEYNEIISKKGEVNSSDEILSFRIELNEFSKSYHEEKTLEYLGQLLPFKYNDRYIVNYSPFVVYSMSPEDISSDLLDYLSSRDFVASVFLSLEPVVCDAVSWEQPDASEESRSTRNTFKTAAIISGIVIGSAAVIAVFLALYNKKRNQVKR